jgi:hypothetical protein
MQKTGKETKIMNRVFWGLFALAAGTSAVFSAKPAAALQLSQNAVQVFPAEGNGVCKDYAANAIILEMGPGNPATNNTGRLTGPENPQDLDLTGESADYSYDPVTKVLNFTNSTTPVDFVLLKSGRQINVYLYPSGGVTEDFGLVLMDPNSDLDTGGLLGIERIVLCYGLEDLQPDNPPPSASFPDCSLDVFPNVGVDCQGAADGTVVSYWDPNTNPNQPDFRQCVCNTAGGGVTVPCDPSGNSDILECFGKDKPIALPEAPIHVELFGDPVYCSTIGGTRTCTCIDNPFTPLVDECAP